MKLIAYIRNNYRADWNIIDTIKKPTITVNIQRTGWVGDAQLESPSEYPLGAELQIVNADTNQTLWLGKIVERLYRSHEKLHHYKLRGICEHFLDLPIPFTQYDQQRERTGNAQQLWEYHLANHIQYHTPRYQPLYNLNLASITTRDYQIRTVRDAYKLYQSLTPCKITPEIIPTGQQGRIRMNLDPLPLTPYPLPRNAQYEITESITETATRISLGNPAKQLIKDRRLTNPEYWQIVVPSGATAAIAVQDPNERGYLGAYATRIDIDITLMVWVGIQYREKIRAPKNNQGQYAPITIGMRAHGDNAQIRLNINGVTSAPQTITPSYTEIAWQITPTTDELQLTIEIQPVTPTLSATAVIDGVYYIPNTQLLNERDYPPHQIVADQIPSYITAGVITQIQSVANQGGGIYDLVAHWPAFPTTISTGTPLQILQNSRYLSGQVVQRNSDTVLRVQIDDPIAPQEGDAIYVRHHPNSQTIADAEYHYDTLYTTLDLPAGLQPTDIAHLLATLAQPRTTLTAQIPVANTPLPQIGQYIPRPRTNQPLPIYSIDLPIINGQLNTIQLQAGSPELTMRALFRKTAPVRATTI